MIAIESLVKRYGTFTAVDGISLDVKPGEIHGFLGPNGAGKTTTLRMIAGLLQPTAGRVVVNGFDLTRQHEHVGLGDGRRETERKRNTDDQRERTSPR